MIEDDLDEEEKERIAKIEQENDDRKRKLYEKQLEEEELKRQKKISAKQVLDKWHEQRKKETEQRRKTNNENEQMHHDSVKVQRNGPNPWERVITNCEMNSSQYVGGADVTRMRQAMIARKADITKAGGMNSKSMM